MNIVPMDTMTGGRERLIGQDITIRITIETLGSGLCNMGSITLLGVEVQTALTLMTPDTNLGLGSSLHCPVWYTGISTGTTSPGRYEAEGQSAVTSTAGVAHHIRPSLETSPRRGWLAKRPDPPGPPAAAALEVDPPAVSRSAAAAPPARTGRFSHPSTPHSPHVLSGAWGSVVMVLIIALWWGWGLSSETGFLCSPG